MVEQAVVVIDSALLVHVGCKKRTAFKRQIGQTLQGSRDIDFGQVHVLKSVCFNRVHDLGQVDLRNIFTVGEGLGSHFIDFVFLPMMIDFVFDGNFAAQAFVVVLIEGLSDHGSGVVFIELVVQVAVFDFCVGTFLLDIGEVAPSCCGSIGVFGSSRYIEDAGRDGHTVEGIELRCRRCLT